MSKKNNVAYMFFNCDEWKGTASMNPLHNNIIYRKRAGRRALWQKIKDEHATGNIIIGDYDNVDNMIQSLKQVRDYILNGNPADANNLITYGCILEVEEAD